MAEKDTELIKQGEQIVIEAVWFKNGKEVDWVDPVRLVEIRGTSISDIYVTNDCDTFFSGDGVISDFVDDFVVRRKRGAV